MIIVCGGDVLTPDGWLNCDVGIEGGRVTGLGTGLIGDVEIDATGCLVGPGLVDLHTHLREPGQTWKEDIATGSAAAAAGGFTAVTAMPNTEPAMDSPEVVQSVLATAAGVDLVDVIASAALTAGRTGGTASPLEDLYQKGVRLFTDDGDSVADPELLEDIMTRIADLPGAFVAQHAEYATITAGGHMHEGAVSRRLGVRGMPSRGETDIVRRDLGLVAKTGARYHCQHVSAIETIEVIKEAKLSGLVVTAEVTPHHLTFDESWVTGLDPDFKMYPPLRSEDDRAALVEALADGTIDAVATDHAPHLAEEKAVGFTDAPRGVIGLETAAAAVWEALGSRDRFFEVLSVAPARILGLESHGRSVEAGIDANLVVFDPSAIRVPGTFNSKSSNSPYHGREMKGLVRVTIRRGQVAYQHHPTDSERTVV